MQFRGVKVGIVMWISDDRRSCHVLAHSNGYIQHYVPMNSIRETTAFTMPRKTKTIKLPPETHTVKVPDRVLVGCKHDPLYLIETR